MTTDDNRTDDVITRGSVKYVVIERRGYVALGYCCLDPLPYAVFSGGRLMARTIDRPCANWIIDGLEEE